MNYGTINEFYEIRLASLITNIDRDSLIELYQPIIGSRAAILYLTLLKEVRYQGTDIVSIEHLLKSMQIGKKELLEMRQTLEAVGLIRTYQSVADKIKCYIFVLYAPKSPKAFFEDVLFKGLLIRAIGEKDAMHLANKYRVNNIIPERYDEVTASFIDVFTLDYDDSSFKKDFGADIIGRDHGRANISFNEDLFFGYINENSQIPQTSFKKKDMKEISRLAALFGLNEKQMAFIAIDEYKSEGPVHFDFAKIKDKCEQEIRFSQVGNTRASKVSGDSQVADKIRLMDECAPAKFLQYLQQGTKPAKSDINIVDSLSKDYGFSNGIINVIVEYVLYKNNNVLSKNYCEKIASSLARQQVVTAVDAMNYLNKMAVKASKTYAKKAESKTVSMVQPSATDDISLDEVKNLINELEVKKNGK